MTWGTPQAPWPDQPGDADDEYPDFLWRDDDERKTPEQASRPGGAGRGNPPGGPASFRWPPPPAPGPSAAAAARRRTAAGLTVTALVAVGLGAGAVLVYRSTQAGSTPPAAVSHGSGLTPGQGAGPAGPGTGPTGPGAVTGIELLGQVTAVGNGSITIGGGPARSVRAAVTSATRFTGTARDLAAVRVGDTVQAQITVVNGIAKLVSLQDPASQP